MRSGRKPLLSKLATNDGHAENSPYFDGWKAYERDPFHPTRNADGVIQMGLAENQLCFDMIEEWLINNPQASICTAQGLGMFKDTAIFQDYHGLPEFRNAVAKFMGRVRGNRAKFDPDRIVMSGGATGAHELISFCLADPGDTFLVPTPYYPGFDRDVCWRTGVQLLPVVCDSSNGFMVTRNALESAYENAKAANTPVKGLLITNPSNPLGTVLDKETLRDILSFVNEKNIHLVSDEIYSATVFNDKPRFTGVSEIIEEDQTLCNPNLVHVIYSLSKDLGFPGFRVGIVYSYNDEVVGCARKMSSFGLVSSQTQHLVASLLSDDVFVEKFLSESARRLENRHRIFTDNLDQVGIKCLQRNAGLFQLMDLSHLLRDKTFEAEMELWKVIIDEVKLNISPGSSFHSSEPGWFRVCIANMDDQTVDVALRRIRAFVSRSEGAMAASAKKKRCWQNQNRKLRVSLSYRRMEELMMMPPLSPIPQSPLLRAQT
ncbi:hypothetical protein SAY86_011002 [Trapa natans]|uniref:1-aminocyclopropane-1-carboxylate synthase n=1 Tax=Trapa natans TaxID=22666 RepID=A0AAN7LMJ3_TRANT|nr:hypothetical protein SAY86_011002 [Trapa natans]